MDTFILVIIWFCRTGGYFLFHIHLSRRFEIIGKSVSLENMFRKNTSCWWLNGWWWFSFCVVYKYVSLHLEGHLLKQEITEVLLCFVPTKFLMRHPPKLIFLMMDWQWHFQSASNNIQSNNNTKKTYLQIHSFYNAPPSKIDNESALQIPLKKRIS